jgi:hypothetical protein
MVALSEIEKRGPRLTPEQKAEQKKQKVQAKVGLGSNVLGLTAGAAATGAALRDERLAGGGKVARALYSVGSKIPAPIARLNAKLGPKGKAALAGGALALQAGNMGGDVVANRVLARSAQTPVKKDYTVESVTEIFISKSDHTTGHGHSMLDKAYRRYDPEADRQRRLGLATGAGAGGALLLGGEATRRMTTKVVDANGNPLKGIAFKHKKAGKGALLAAGAVGSGAAGLAAYRKGVSERNNPWN